MRNQHFFPLTRVMLLLAAVLCIPQAAVAIPPFFEQFNAKYVGENPSSESQQALAALVASEETGKCLVCHVKGEKKSVRNDYGENLHKLLDKKNFSKERMESDGDAARAEIVAALEAVAALRAIEGDEASVTFGELIAMGKLPGDKESAKVATTEPAQSPKDTAAGGTASELLELLVAEIKADLKSELIEELKSELSAELAEAIRGEIKAQREAEMRAVRAVAEKTHIAKIEEIGGTVREIALNDDRREVDFHLGGKSLTDEGLAHVKQLDRVVHLHLKDTQVTDDGLMHIAGLRELMKLHLEKTKITDQGLAHLADLQNLEYLNIYGTEVTDAGLDQLAGLKNLKKLYIWQTQVTIPGFQKAQAAMPHVEIIPDLVEEKKRAEEEAIRKVEEEKRKAEEAKKKAEEEAKKKAEEEAKKKAEEEAKKKAEEEAKKKEEEDKEEDAKEEEDKEEEDKEEDAKEEDAKEEDKQEDAKEEDAKEDKEEAA